MKNKILTLIAVFALAFAMCIALVSCGGSEPTVVSVEYALSGGSLSDDAPKSYNFGEAPDFTKVVPTKENYTFSGWYLNKDLSTPLTSEGIAENNSKVTLYAKWSAAQFNINYELDGGVGADLPEKYVYGESTKLASHIPEKEGYIFSGWFFDEDLTKSAIVIDDESTGDITVYAKWRLAPTKVSDIEDVTKGYFGIGYTTLTLDVSKYVNANDSKLVYTATSSDPEVATVKLNGSELSIEFLKNSGSTDITLDVSVGSTKYLTFEFTASPKVYKRIACVGDSLTASMPAYPKYLEEFLDDSVTVGNFGKSGASLSTFTNNDKYDCYKVYGKTEYEASLAFDADLVIIMLGTNDATKIENGAPKYDWDEVAPAYKADYLALIEEYKTAYPNADIVLMTSPEVMSNNTLSISNDILENNTYPLQLEIAELAGVKLVDLRAYLKEFSNKENFYRDGTHFNDDGAATIADYVLKSI